MPNDQMPNYTVQTQYISIRSTSLQKGNQIQEKVIKTNRTDFFLSQNGLNFNKKLNDVLGGKLRKRKVEKKTKINDRGK